MCEFCETGLCIDQAVALQPRVSDRVYHGISQSLQLCTSLQESRASSVSVLTGFGMICYCETYLRPFIHCPPVVVKHQPETSLQKLDFNKLPHFAIIVCPGSCPSIDCANSKVRPRIEGSRKCLSSYCIAQPEPSSSCKLLRPLSSSLNSCRLILFPSLCNVVCKRIIWVRCTEEGLYGK